MTQYIVAAFSLTHKGNLSIVNIEKAKVAWKQDPPSSSAVNQG